MSRGTLIRHACGVPPSPRGRQEVRCVSRALLTRNILIHNGFQAAKQYGALPFPRGNVPTSSCGGRRMRVDRVTASSVRQLTYKLQSLVPLPFFAPFQKAAAKTHKPTRSPTEPAGEVFVYFYQRRKIFKIFCENPLTILAFCDKIVNCIIIAFTMGISAFRQGPQSKKGDFTRFSLCNLTNTKGERSIRLRPRHLPCPWVVRLTHEVPDVRADVF